MPGIKRTAASLSKGEKKRSHGDKVDRRGLKEKSRDARKAVIRKGAASEYFDDGEDLMAIAMAENGGLDMDDPGEGSNSSEHELGENGEVEMFSDEDMEGGFEDVAEDIQGQAGPSGKTNKNSLYAIPSRDEMSALKNTCELYKSNIFKLKVEEMITQIKPKYDSADTLDYVLRQIKLAVEAIPEIEAQVLDKAIRLLQKSSKGKGVSVPFPDPRPKAISNITFGFAKASRVQIVGSWILKSAALRPDGADVDMVITMPSELFQEKDHMNMRYFHKRAYYLATIACTLSKLGKDLGFRCEYYLHQNDPRRPNLLLLPIYGGSADFSRSKASIKIHLAIDEDVFPSRRLNPSRNNLRIEERNDANQPPTPCYNASVLADSLYASHLVYLNATSQMSPSFSDACLLLKTWCSQRSFGSGSSKEEVKGKIPNDAGRRMASGSSGMRFIVTMLLAHLLHGSEKSRETGAKSKLSPGFSSYQLFRGVIDFLATHDFSANPIFMKGLDGLLSRRDKIDQKEFVLHSRFVVVDPTGSINLLQSVDNGTFEFLQVEAKATVMLLNDPVEDHFEEIFMRKRWKPSFIFDEVLLMDLKKISTDAAMLANLGSPLQVAIHHTSRIIKQALNSRANLLTFFPDSPSTWSISSDMPRESTKVEVGIMLDPRQAFRLVDHGPRPEDQVASEAFKQFWGEIADLRRFRDGRIVESVVWSVNGIMGKYSIPEMVLRHIIPRHCNVSNATLVFHSDAYKELLEPNKKLAANVYLSLPEQGGFQVVQTAFDELVKQLRCLEDLPLSIISVVGANSGLRGMSVMIPCAINRNTKVPMCSSHVPIHDFVITLESSGRWPDDLSAIRAMKMAFYEAMAKKLQLKLPSCQANVVIDSDANENGYWDCAALDIVLSSGLAFRGRIHHERERTLLNRIIDDKVEEQYIKSMAKAALERFEKRFEHSVRHHNHMAALSHRFVSLSLAVRLFKRWISCQMFSLDVPEEISELIVASVYIKASLENLEPSFGHVGFIQTLQMLRNWNWREEPLIVAMIGATSATPTSAIASELQKDVQIHFDQHRRSDPGLNHFAWFIATENEPSGSNWAKNKPSAGIANGLQILSRGACDVLASGPYLDRDHIKSLFKPSLNHLDFLIKLKPTVMNRYIDNLSFDESLLNRSKYSMQKNEAVEASLHAGLDTGKEFTLLLEYLYLDTMHLYYDCNGGCNIGGIFNPSLSKARPFRVGLGFNSMPINEESKDVLLNHEDVLAEIERLGEGIIETIERRKD